MNEEPEYQIRQGRGGSRIAFACIACRSPYKADLADAGRPFTCAACRATMTIPGADAAEYLRTAEQRLQEERQAERARARTESEAAAAATRREKSERVKRQSQHEAARRAAARAPWTPRRAIFDCESSAARLYGIFVVEMILALLALPLLAVAAIGLKDDPAVMFIPALAFGVAIQLALFRAAGAHMSALGAQTRLLMRIADRLERDPTSRSEPGPPPPSP